MTIYRVLGQEGNYDSSKTAALPRAITYYFTEFGIANKGGEGSLSRPKVRACPRMRRDTKKLKKTTLLILLIPS
ncbi:MAG: hypothetical protein LBO67_02355 [Spirochaetaceae bacterium]|jgi:hypothetical protein|nr:hypothetical protein [Spirochaetaceae bacterium]